MTNRQVQNALLVLNGSRVLLGPNVVAQDQGVLDWPFSAPWLFRLGLTAEELDGTNPAYNTARRKVRRRHMREVKEKDEEGKERKVQRLPDDAAEDELSNELDALQDERVKLSVYKVPASMLVEAYRRHLEDRYMRLKELALKAEARAAGEDDDDDDEGKEAAAAEQVQGAVREVERLLDGELLPPRVFVGLGPLVEMDLTEQEPTEEESAES